MSLQPTESFKALPKVKTRRAGMGIVWDDLPTVLTIPVPPHHGREQATMIILDQCPVDNAEGPADEGRAM